MQEQRLAEPSPPPGGSHAEKLDPAEVRLAREVWAAEDETGDLVSVEGEEPERGVEGVAVAVPATPLLEALLVELPVVGEGAHVRCVDPLLLAVAHRPNHDPLR